MRNGWALLALVACGGGEGADPADTANEPSPTAPLPTPDYAERGPYTAGTEAFTVAGPEGLTLTAQIWYPSDDPAGDPITYDGLLDGEASEGLAPACASPRPVVVFSHGLGGIRWQSPFIVEHLATHGFVVVAVDHPGSTLFDSDFRAIAEVAVRRPADVAAAFDGAAEAYGACVDPTAGYAGMGHSFGGYTAFAAGGAVVNDPTAGGAPIQLGDARVWAVVALAPWDGAGAITDGNAAITSPTLVLTGREDITTPLSLVRGLWTHVEVEPRRFAIFDEAGHYSFSPAACLLETGDGCGDGFLGEAELYPLVNRPIAAFLSAVLGVDGAGEQVDPDAAGVTWQGQGEL